MHSYRVILALVLGCAVACGGSGGPGPRGNVREITFPAGVKGSSPRFSPDGARLAYARHTDTTDELAVMSTAGADSQSLTSDGSYLLSMAWTADASEIFYGSSDTGMRAVPAAGGASRFVVDAFAAIDPDLSPDGRSLVYGLNGSTIHIADLGQDPPVATDLAVPGYSPRFSPDGARLAFVSGDKVSVMDLASRTVTDVMDATNPLARVDWFPDGLRLVTGANHGIDIVTLGPPVVRRQILDNWAVLDVDLSPDGTSVAFGVNGHPELSVLSDF